MPPLTVLEFYIGRNSNYLLRLQGYSVPRSGEYISIARITYKISRVTWAVDFLGNKEELKANIELELL